MRITPYRTLDDRIDGVVITFWDISVAKALEGKMQDIQNHLETRLAKQSTEIIRAKAAIRPKSKRAGKTPGPSKA